MLATGYSRRVALLTPTSVACAVDHRDQQFERRGVFEFGGGIGIQFRQPRNSRISAGDGRLPRRVGDFAAGLMPCPCRPSPTHGRALATAAECGFRCRGRRGPDCAFRRVPRDPRQPASRSRMAFARLPCCLQAHSRAEDRRQSAGIERALRRLRVESHQARVDGGIDIAIAQQGQQAMRVGYFAGVVGWRARHGGGVNGP